MELVNKDHKKIKKSKREQGAYYLKIVDKRTILFSVAAVKKYALVPGLYVQFQNDENHWYFFSNSERQGFKILSNHGSRATALIRNKSLVDFIFESTKCSLGEKYIIRLTGARLSGHHMMEIDFRNPVRINESVKLLHAS